MRPFREHYCIYIVVASFSLYFVTNTFAKADLSFLKNSIPFPFTIVEFSISPEGIAPGILSSRLKWLEGKELITKQKLPNNQKENIYLLTEKGIELAPVITEIILWSDKNLREHNSKMFFIAELGLHQDKSKVIAGIQNNYRQLVQETLS